MRKITVLVDRPLSWYNKYLESLTHDLVSAGHQVRLIRDYSELDEGGDFAFFLSCGKIVPVDYLRFHRHNIVVHASALPHGKGFAPLSWQVLEGKNRIPVTLFEAVESVDAGPYYLRDEVVLEGHELLEEIHAIEGETINRMIVQFVNQYEQMRPLPQVGDSSFYRRRTPADSQLDPSQSIDQQFNLLRIVDNEQYPAFFEKNGHRYLVKITKVI